MSTRIGALGYFLARCSGTEPDRIASRKVLRGFPWLEPVDSRGGDDWVECRDGNTLIALRPFARPR